MTLNSYPTLTICPKRRTSELVEMTIDKELLVYDLRTHKAFCFSETTALVWRKCDGKRSVSEIKRSINKHLGSAATDDIVWIALDQLRRENLLENGEMLSTGFEGFSRRDMIKRIGLSSLVVMPSIKIVVAPDAQAAASALVCPALNKPIGCPCTPGPVGNASCISQNCNSNQCGPPL